MTIAPGARLGHYEITAKLGAGGMGTVWRATDTKLGREVALKLLPEEFARDPERHARFEREAKLLASLNHPNIAALHTLEHVADKHALVMELVEGEGLDELIARGPVAVDKAIPIALQIAEALEVAHERGIVHRDLKPANVRIRPDGTVKVLDFGLAKAWEAEGTDSSLSLSPTLTALPTAAGVILGTAAYMSPEQARGKKVDRRADIWAFGVVLWEMLTGRRLFEGETVSDVLAAVLTKDPEFEKLPADTPRRVHELVARCLRRDARRRARDIGDIRLELEELSAVEEGDPLYGGETTENRRPPAWAPWVVAAVATVAAISLAWVLVNSPRAPKAAPSHLALTLPQGLAFELREQRPVVVVSPGGDEVVLNATDGKTSRLYRRSLGSDILVPLAGTEGAWAPFFSPDGHLIGFTSADGRIKKLSLDGGQPVALAEGRWGGGSWGEDGSIVYTPNYLDGLWRVAASGSEPEQLTAPDPSAGELNHSWPDHIPGAEAVVFTSFRLPLSESRVEVFDLSTRERRLLVPNAVYGRYAASGHLLFVREGAVLAAPFDPQKLELTGPPVPVLEDAFVAPYEGNSQFSVADTGTLVHVPASLLLPPRELVWIDRQGRDETLLDADRRYGTPSLSPDGRSVAVTVDGANPDVWIYSLDRKVLSRLTFSSRSEHSPIWFPNGRQIAFVLDAPPFHIYSVAADGSGAPSPIFEGSTDSRPEAISSDGRLMVVRLNNLDENFTLGLLDVGQRTTLRPLHQTQFVERYATLSPDNRYLAYDSNETGRREIFVQSFPEPGVRIQVTRDGGEAPLWAGNSELFFWRGDRLHAVQVRTTPELTIGEPESLFTAQRYTTDLCRDYDVSADGRRILIARIPQASRPREAEVVLNWFSELERLAGPGGHQ